MLIWKRNVSAHKKIPAQNSNLGVSCRLQCESADRWMDTILKFIPTYISRAAKNKYLKSKFATYKYAQLVMRMHNEGNNLTARTFPVYHQSSKKIL